MVLHNHGFLVDAGLGQPLEHPGRTSHNFQDILLPDYVIEQVFLVDELELDWDGLGFAALEADLVLGVVRRVQLQVLAVALRGAAVQDEVASQLFYAHGDLPPRLEVVV